MCEHISIFLHFISENVPAFTDLLPIADRNLQQHCNLCIREIRKIHRRLRLIYWLIEIKLEILIILVD